MKKLSIQVPFAVEKPVLLIDTARGRPKTSMAKLDRGQGRYRPRYRKTAGWDSATRNRVPLPYCCGAEKPGSEA